MVLTEQRGDVDSFGNDADVVLFFSRDADHCQQGGERDYFMSCAQQSTRISGRWMNAAEPFYTDVGHFTYDYLSVGASKR